VRAASATRVTGARVARAGKALAALPLDDAGKALAERAELVASAFATALADLLGRQKARDLSTAEAARAVEPVASWAARAARALPKPWDLPKAADQVAASRAWARLERLRQALAAAAAGVDGTARWVEAGASGPALCVSPVDVSGAIAANLWGAGEASAVLVSATMPAGIAIEAGLGRVGTDRYPSPFEAAYQRCALYIPKMPRTLLGGGDRLDLAAHVEWATGEVVALVGANKGSALVLAATTEAALSYGAALRGASGGWAVHVVGDAPAQALVEAWRADTASVLVGRPAASQA
jgi:ATP-dependent DNA helicase DinG